MEAGELQCIYDSLVVGIEETEGTMKELEEKINAEGMKLYALKRKKDRVLQLIEERKEQ